LFIALYYLPILGKLIWPYYLSLPISYALKESVVLYIYSWCVYLLINFTFFVIYYLKWDFFERYKHNPEPWPWEKDPVAWKKLLKRTMKAILFNNFVVVPPFFALNAWLADYKCLYSEDIESLPDSKVLLLTMIFCTLCETFVTTTTHAILHHPRLYPHIHKIHHEHVTTVCISTEYAHPIEYIVGNIIPISVGPMLLGKHIHLYTMMLFFGFRILMAAEDHSGYSFSWSTSRLMPFMTDPDYHNFHHSHN